MGSSLKVSILIPAYNEESSILEVLEQVRAQAIAGVEFEVIVVDDGSKDKTLDRLRSRPTLYDKLVCLPQNGGKGAALKAGLSHATGEYVLFQDADLEYDPAEYANLIRPVRKFKADLVLGSRIIAPRYLRIHYFWNRLGNHLITLCFNLLFNKTFTDIYTCYLMYRRELIRPEDLRCTGFDQQAEILARLMKAGNAFYEVPISYHGRTYEEGKKIRPYHALPVLWAIFKCRFLR
ncbi:MAG: glycosyltransferase family 2 protein [Elusimicrobia bacterium]|nr:glycosyltransferase family 2 protein [Elusimicrobiota bacterium]